MEELREAIKWKPFPDEDFKDRYEISNLGVVRCIKTGNVLNRSIRSDYLSVNLSKKDKTTKSFKIHRMVALAFIKNKNPEKKCVNHINDFPHGDIGADIALKRHLMNFTVQRLDFVYLLVY